MKILSLGLDNSLFKKNSALAGRIVEYGKLVEKYTVIVPSADSIELALSEKAKVYGSGGGNKLAQFIKICRTAQKLLREEKYDIITVQDQYYLALIGVRLVKKFKIGLEIQIHGFEKYYGLRKLIAKYVLLRANSIRCVSQRLKQQLINEFGVKEEKITVVPIYIDTGLSLRATEESAFSPGLDPGNLTYLEVNQRLPRRSDYGAPRNDMSVFIFLTVGRLVKVKNIGMQIEAMADVIKKYLGAELWIIGDGSEKKSLELQIKNYKLEKNVKLFGWQEKLEKYYSQSDAFVLSSNSEGWGLAVIEAANYGLPIVMTDVGCAGEVIKDGESGLVISVGDKAGLIKAMIKIIEDENLRKKIGANAESAVSRLPSKEQILELYKKSWEIAVISKL